MDAKYFNRIVDTYGIGADEFLDLFLLQRHACAVCRCPLVLFSTKPEEQAQVDHCHSSGKVRGILCRTCNITVGFLEKNPGRTARAAEYIEHGAAGPANQKADRVKGPSKEESKDWTPKEWREWRLRVKPPCPERAKRHTLRYAVKKVLDKTGSPKDDGKK